MVTPSAKCSSYKKDYPCRILAGNRISIPKPIFKDLKLKVGDWILVERLDNGSLQVTPAVVIPR